MPAFLTPVYVDDAVILKPEYVADSLMVKTEQLIRRSPHPLHAELTAGLRTSHCQGFDDAPSSAGKIDGRLSQISLPWSPQHRVLRQVHVRGTMEKIAQIVSTAPLVETGTMVMTAQVVKMEQTETTLWTELMLWTVNVNRRSPILCTQS